MDHHDEKTSRGAATSARKSPARPIPETDPRFPSGEWKGFWVQKEMRGRQWMRLALEFCGGKILGEGRDIIGRFVLSGSYDLKSGRCGLLKAYLGQHSVSYQGFNDGDGLWMWGTWKIAEDSGGFHIWPKGEPDPTGSELKEEKDIPVERELVLTGADQDTESWSGF
jgi:hypothetical protein